ncbi:hypothetical protein ISN45_At01g054890 [Arabidopsis thaliana x Arabidopsis arenosa]|uniref:Transmembrane protein n=3 Tax=Arabidopsis TaxID=3701 RepID=A0A178WLA1_ARATH|nr:hypothetical protein ISN45_At01g054890 [Arabidopsis thaliana x Arabidopsis arenosa]KAG7658415.1 hypothetical protein ISN44_As01g053950 [Arabidopsis suecica]OAP18944.1 hypothetical protein AXX17_AT1G58040 [Arabidopsis thaliana]
MSYNTKLVVLIFLLFTITSTDVSNATPRHFVNLRSEKGIVFKEDVKIKERELVEFHLDYARTGANQDHEPGKGRP